MKKAMQSKRCLAPAVPGTRSARHRCGWRRAAGAVWAGIVAASMAGAPAAFAVDASAGAQTGTGSTDVTVQLVDAAGEHSGTQVDPTNPDGDGDGLGDNLAFTVPSSINFVAKSDGTLIGPAAASTYIENESVFAIHASSVQVAAADGWNVVGDASASSTANAVDFTFGPDGDELSAADCLEKAAVGDASKWSMTARKADPVVTDRVQLETAGHVNNVDAGIQAKTKVAEIHTYVTPGAAS